MTSFNPYHICLPPAQILPFLTFYLNGTPKRIDIPTGNSAHSYELLPLNNKMKNINPAAAPVHHLVVVSPNIPHNGVNIRVCGDGNTILEGKLFRATPITATFSASVVSVVLDSAEIEISTSRAEEFVVQGVVEILADEIINPRQGSLPSETVKSLVKRRCPLRFDSVVAKHESWEKFLFDHSGDFTTFKYSENELKSRGLIGQISPDEIRVVRNVSSRSKSGGCSSSCAAPPDLPPQTGKLLLPQDGKDCFALLHTPQLKENLQKSCASFSLMMRFLQKHNQKFRWSTDPTQRTVIGLIQH